MKDYKATNENDIENFIQFDGVSFLKIIVLCFLTF